MASPDEERERRVFFSWQSDTPAKTNRTVIEAALAKACTDQHAQLSPSDRPEKPAKVQSASSGVVGARQIADVIFERIRTADVFVADVSLVVRCGKRLMPNPNVLVETGYALHALTDARIVLVLNTELGRVEDLPFDLRGRLAMPYALTKDQAPAEARTALTKAFAGILPRILSLPRTTQDVRVEVGVFDLVPVNNPKARKPMLVTTVRNFSDFPVRLVTLSYEYAGDGGFVVPGQQHEIAPPIPARDSRTFNVPISVVADEKVVRVSVKDSLGRTFASDPGAVEAALQARTKR